MMNPEKRRIANALRGMPLEEVKMNLETLEIPYTIVRDGNNNFVTTCDFNAERARLSIDNGVVVRVTFG